MSVPTDRQKTGRIHIPVCMCVYDCMFEGIVSELWFIGDFHFLFIYLYVCNEETVKAGLR